MDKMKNVILTTLAVLTLSACNYTGAPDDNEIQGVSMYGSKVVDSVITTNEGAYDEFYERGSESLVAYSFSINYRNESLNGDVVLTADILRATQLENGELSDYEVIKTIEVNTYYEKQLKVGKSGYFVQKGTEIGEFYTYKMTLTIDDNSGIIDNNESHSSLIRVGVVEQF